MKLPLKQFKNIVRDSPLIAIDLIISNKDKEVLLGRRQNPPAKGYLFVPGGRVLKNETLNDALIRISKKEIGVEITAENAEFHGVYEHIYKENFFNNPTFNTHYVIIACRFQWDSCLSIKSDDQHDEINFMSVEKIINHPDVHTFTKNYFYENPENLFLRLK